MSTGYQTPNFRFQILASQGLTLFHTDDLANLWNIQNTNTLYVTIHRYLKQKLLYKVYKGFYSIKPVVEYAPFFLGIKAMHRYCYVSTESVLAYAGVIMQSLPAVTLISGESKKFSIIGQNYICRKLNDFALFNSIGIEEGTDFKKATVERAVADLLFYNNKFHFDNSKIIDWERVREIQIELGYNLTPERYLK